MYIPREFAVRERERIVGFMQKYPFAQLLTPVDGGDIEMTLVPVVTVPGEQIEAYFHLSVFNEHWKKAQGRRSYLVFFGPHHYISARWYGDRRSVPTWNYAVVKAAGSAQVTDEEKKAWILRRLSEVFDAEWASWHMEREDYYRTMMREIVGMRFLVESLEAKFKMSQNRPLPDRLSAIEHLRGACRTAGKLLSSWRASWEMWSRALP
ncbi:FMN-binding negative transcriptional regulator [Thermogymnomonas acidicola]|uniref:FMN-binding negative transcriptional regulator n=1 Tax=Thermogymnomonas acidicola TaxID=399579 RepID=UPI00094678E8|nr:FMN-binding negative transcriptional regulator [Thermogymnomonas acidicola]